MPSSYSFLVPIQAALAANGQQNLAYTVPNTAVLHMYGWVWKSTGIFQINQFQDNTGIQFTSATQASPIDSSLLSVFNTPNAWLPAFPKIIDIEGGKAINILVQDTSAAPNTVKVLIYAVIDYSSGGQVS